VRVKGSGLGLGVKGKGKGRKVEKGIVRTGAGIRPCLLFFFRAIDAKNGM